MNASVVIAYYRGLSSLDVQLDALAQQDFTGQFEVIISDNEGSAELRDHLEDHPLADRLRLRLIDSADIAGTSHARNVGTRCAAYEFIAYCDQDDAVHPGWLAALVETGRTADLVGGPLEAETLNTPEIAAWRVMPALTEAPILGRFLPITFGCNIGVRRPVFDAVGGWDESYPTAGSDIEFCWRVQIAGYKFAFAPDAMVAYRYRTGLRETYEQAVEYGQAEARVAKQYGAPGRGWWMFPIHAAVVVGMCPVWPWAWSRRRRGYWMFVTGNLIGRIRGSIQYRVLYW